MKLKDGNERLKRIRNKRGENMEPYFSNKVQVGDVINLYNSKGIHSWVVKEQLKGLEYVVTRTGMEGGGTGHGFNDVYPDGWHVTAQTLSQDRTYTPEGKIVDFYQSGAFLNTIEQVKVIGKMKQTFAPDNR